MVFLVGVVGWLLHLIVPLVGRMQRVQKWMQLSLMIAVEVVLVQLVELRVLSQEVVVMWLVNGQV